VTRRPEREDRRGSTSIRFRSERRVARKVRKKLGEILLEEGIVTEEVLSECQEIAAERGRKLGEVLVEEGKATEAAVTRAVALQQGFEFIDLDSAEGSALVDMSLLPEKTSRQHGVIPLARNESGRLRLAITDPTDLDKLDGLRFAIADDFEVVAAPPSQVAALLGGQGASLGGASIDVTLDKSIARWTVRWTVRSTPRSTSMSASRRS
jgi:hypothetical protein